MGKRKPMPADRFTAARLGAYVKFGDVVFKRVIGQAAMQATFEMVRGGKWVGRAYCLNNGRLVPAKPHA